MFRRFRATAPNFEERRAGFYASYWENAAQQLGAHVNRSGNDYLEVASNGSSARVKGNYVDLDTYFSRGLADDKVFVTGLVGELGFFAPRFREYTLRSLSSAVRFLEEVGGPCVVKPRVGSGGCGITTAVNTRRRLIEASLATSNSLTLPELIIEEQIAGDSYRLLYLDGTLLHGVKRGRCTVIGDGRSTIRELVDRENVSRLTDSTLQSLSPLTVDLEMKYVLTDQGKTLRTVPARGERVVVKNVCNQNCRRDQEDVTAHVHADYAEFATAIGARVGGHLIGIDMMSEDVSVSPSQSGTAITEINIPPGLHYHELIENQHTYSGVGPAVLKYLLREP
jgi:cyanophycin synthetase